jgi:hypothetical protein
MDNTGKDKQKEVNLQEDSTGKSQKKPDEIGGPKGLEPTRYGDWEKNGRVSDF